MLHELIRYAERTGLTSEPGFKAKTVKWLLIFDSKGRFIGIQNLAGEDKKSKGHVFPTCPDLTQPEMIAAGRGTRHFLVDSLDKVVLLTKDELTEKLEREHSYFVDLLKQSADVMPVLGPIADVLGNTESLAAIRAELDAQKAKPVEGATIAIQDATTGEVHRIVEDDSWHDWWRSFRAKLLSARQARDIDETETSEGDMLCLLSGVPIDPAATHPKIAGLSDVGGLSMGDALTSFDKDAFTSYDLAQGRNAAVSTEMATAYAGALNHLIRNRSRRLAGVKVAYWYAGAKPIEGDDDIADLIIRPEGFDTADDDVADGEAPPTRGEVDRSEGRAKQLLEAINAGKRPDLIDARFFAMTLSANSGRVVVRDWMEESFPDLVRSVNAWFDDLSIIARDGQHVVRQFKLLSIVGACVRDLKDATSALQTGLWRAALFGQAIPHQLAAQALRRAQLEIINGESMQHRRFALLKAYLIRKGIKMSAELDEHLNEPAYLCGRILALLAAIQRRALGDVGAGVVQRYYAAASATPALVLGRLIRTANTGHIPKIDPPSTRDWYEQELGRLWTQMPKQPPLTLTLEEQTLFAMGYYQQLARRNAPAAATAPPAKSADTI